MSKAFDWYVLIRHPENVHWEINYLSRLVKVNDNCNFVNIKPIPGILFLSQKPIAPSHSYAHSYSPGSHYCHHRHHSWAEQLTVHVDCIADIMHFSLSYLDLVWEPKLGAIKSLKLTQFLLHPMSISKMEKMPWATVFLTLSVLFQQYDSLRRECISSLFRTC